MYDPGENRVGFTKSMNVKGYRKKAEDRSAWAVILNKALVTL